MIYQKKPILLPVDLFSMPAIAGPTLKIIYANQSLDLVSGKKFSS
jgi:hypothetical protein